MSKSLSLPCLQRKSILSFAAMLVELCELVQLSKFLQLHNICITWAHQENDEDDPAAVPQEKQLTPLLEPAPRSEGPAAGCKHNVRKLSVPWMARGLRQSAAEANKENVRAAAHLTRSRAVAGSSAITVDATHSCR